MIQANERKQINKRLSRQYKLSAASAHAHGQTTLNAVLWSLIKEQGQFAAMKKAEETGEEVELTGDCSISMPIKNIDVPKNFALKIKVDDGVLSVIATTVKPKSNILLADGSNAPSIVKDTPND